MEYQYVFQHPGRIIVIGDVHGDSERLISCLRTVHIINENMEWIAQPSNTIVVQLGDQIDSLSRGGSPYWENSSDLNVLIVMDKLDNIAIAAGGGGRVLSLLGNHEMMNVLNQFSFVSEYSKSLVSLEQRTELFTRGSGLCNAILSKRNVVIKIGTYIFCHAGVLPSHIDMIDGLDTLNVICRKFLKRIPLEQNEINILTSCIINDTGILWNREYVNMQHSPEVLNAVISNVLSRTDCTCMFIVHNTIEKIHSVDNDRLFFVDAGLSRSYPFDRIQILEINTIDASTNTDMVTVVDIRQ